MRKKEYLYFFIIILGYLILSVSLYKLLQNKEAFGNTIGLFLKQEKKLIKNVSSPYITVSYAKVNENSLTKWDAVFYNYISKQGYYSDGSWPSAGSYAFAPLFPFIWSLTGLNIIGICFLNFILYSLSIFILFRNVFKFNLDNLNKIILIIICLALPSVVVYFIPYCEALTTITFVLAILGMMRNKYWLYFLGAYLYSLSRPSSIVLLLTILIIEFLYFIKNKNLKDTIVKTFLMAIPLVIGIISVTVIQYMYSGSLFKFWDLHKEFWNYNLRLPNTITDWSTESYGMNIFAILFIVLPLMSALLFKQIKKIRLPENSSCFTKNNNIKPTLDIKIYIAELSVVYFFISFMVVLFFQGGGLWGMHRYVFASPFFLFFLFFLFEKICVFKYKYILPYLMLFVLGYMFLIHGPYQHRISISDMGFFNYSILFLFFLSYKQYNRFFKILGLSVIILSNIVWQTFLFNNFLSSPWCFL